MSIPWLPVHWLLSSVGPQQPCYWLWKIDKLLCENRFQLRCCNALHIITYEALSRLHKPWSYVFEKQNICQQSWNSGPWFNIKMTSYQYRESHCGDKTIYDRLISTMGFPMLVRRHLDIESGPRNRLEMYKILKFHDSRGLLDLLLFTSAFTHKDDQYHSTVALLKWYYSDKLSRQENFTFTVLSNLLHTIDTMYPILMFTVFVLTLCFGYFGSD